MPRNKVGMTLIEDRKKRKVTFKNRSDGLIEKTRQLTILTGCDALCICYEARRDQASRGVAAKTWPADHEKVQNMIQRYRDMPADRSRQVLTPLTFNEEELNKEQRKVVRVQQCDPGELGPWDTSFDVASDGELKSLLGTLDETLQRVQQRMVALGLVGDDMIVPASNAADVATPLPYAMSLPENGFKLGGSLPNTAGSMLTQYYYDLPDDNHMLQQPSPLQPSCHGYQMPPPYLSYPMMPPPPPPYLSYQMPQLTLPGTSEFGATGYATNVVNGASAAPASEFYDDLMQGFDAAGGGAYVNADVLGQALSAGPPRAGFPLAHHSAVGVWPVSKQDNPMDVAAFQLRNDFAGSESCNSSTSSQGGFQN